MVFLCSAHVIVSKEIDVASLPRRRKGGEAKGAGGKKNKMYHFFEDGHSDGTSSRSLCTSSVCTSFDVVVALLHCDGAESLVICECTFRAGADY